ncbi:MAG: hypothetical protein JST58_02165 [Bacteroidetes bacterium]|nr:hypothetical protein [Bacteroidota bacterium]
MPTSFLKITLLARQLFLFSFFLCLFQSCLGPKKINKWVATQYGATPAPTKPKTDLIKISSNLPSMDNRLSTTEKKTSHLLPLLFYWQWDYKNTCSLNPQIAVHNFTSTVMSYSNKGLKQKLNGRRLELTIEKIPTRFAIDDKGHLIWVILYAFGWETLTLQPEDNIMVVSYKLFNTDNSMAKDGSINIQNSDKKLTLGMLQSLKKKTFQYLEQYDASITTMSKTFVDKLYAEL